MTPELKAKELVEKFMPHTDCAGDAASYSEAKEIQKMQAKACAIICVDEILNAHAFKAASGHRTFWLNVRKQIMQQQ